MHAPMQCFQNALACFAMAIVGYAIKMFMKSTPGANVLKNNTMVNYHGNFNPTISRVKILW